MKFLIYGVTGYTGQLVAEHAKELGLSPVLAGRNAEKTRAVAEPLGFDWTAFDLSETGKLHDALKDMDAVVHIAGPFSATSKPMADACIATGTHYLDITGEIDVFEALAARSGEAETSGVMLMPGCGFDVVPTDCLALHMKNRMPQARALDLAVMGLGHVSRGTAKTAVEGIRNGSRARRDGRILRLTPPEEKTFAFPKGEKRGLSVSWGDVSTAYHTTGIADITVFFEASGQMKKMANMNPVMRWLLGTGPGQNWLKSKIDQRPPGPTPEQRAKGYSEILGVVRDGAGNEMRSFLTTPEGYSLTAWTTMEIVKRLGAGAAKPGFQTPAGLFGADFILDFDRCERQDLE